MCIERNFWSEAVRSQKRLQAKFGRGRLCNCKPIGQKPAKQIKHIPVFLTPLIYQQKKSVELLLILHPLLINIPMISAADAPETDGTPWQD